MNGAIETDSNYDVPSVFSWHFLEAPVAEAIRIRSDLAEGRFVRVSQKDMTVRANGGRKSECFIYVNSFEESARVHVCMQNQLLC